MRYLDELKETHVDILRAVAEGKNYKVIANKLILSEETVKDYMKEAKYVLNANTYAHMIAIAIRKEII